MRSYLRVLTLLTALGSLSPAGAVTCWAADAGAPGDSLAAAARRNPGHHDSAVIEDLSDATLAQVAARRNQASASTPAAGAPVSVSQPVAPAASAAAEPTAAPEQAPTREASGPAAEPRLQAVAVTSPPVHPQPGNKLMDSPSAIVGPQANKFPLSTHDKFMLFANDMKDPMNILAAGWNAGIDQWSDAHTQFGQGSEGYGKRLGANMADTATGSLLQGFLIPALFHEDPRYFTSGKHGTGARLKYAVTRVLIARSDSGKSTFNASEILGVAATSAIENVYYPNNRTPGDTATRAGTAIAVDAGWDVLKEFWPELARKFKLPIWFQRLFWSSTYTFIYNRPVAVTPTAAPATAPTETTPAQTPAAPPAEPPK